MKKPALIGVLFLLAVFAVVLYSTMTMSKYKVKVCMQYQGRTNCATSSGATKETALRSAVTTACATIAGGVTASMQCERAEPASTEWKQ